MTQKVISGLYTSRTRNFWSKFSKCVDCSEATDGITNVLRPHAFLTAISAGVLLSPVSIQTQSLALRALRKRKPQETQALALASSQSWLPLLRPSIPIGWRLRLLREIQASACVSCGFRLRNARIERNASDCVWMETGLQSTFESVVSRR